MKWAQREVVNFQNGLLQAAGFTSTVADLTSTTLAFCENAFLAYQDRNPLSSELFELYKSIFTGLLTWRKDVLMGGAVLGDFYTDVGTLYDLILEVVPAVCIGGMILSPRGAFRQGEGVGVDIAQALQLRDSIESLVHEGRRCPFDMHHPRSCVVSEHSLCKQLVVEAKPKERCVREITLHGVLKGLGIVQVERA